MKLQPLCRTIQSHEGMTRMKNKIIKLLAWICIGLSFGVITACDNTKGSEPMLKITTSTAVGFYFSNTHYHIVYDNGAVKKTEKFVPAKVKCYAFNPAGNYEDSTLLHLYDEYEGLNEIANNILLLMDETKFEKVAIGRLYILGGRYFFDALCYNGKKNIDKLMEYISTDNSIKEIASFNSGSITHVELYSS